MIAVTSTPVNSNDATALKRACEWADDTYAIHFDRCRATRDGLDCLKCLQLEADAVQAWQALREASIG